MPRTQTTPDTPDPPRTTPPSGREAERRGSAATPSREAHERPRRPSAADGDDEDLDPDLPDREMDSQR